MMIKRIPRSRAAFPATRRPGLYQIAHTSASPWNTARRPASSEAGDNKTGHINSAANEGVIFFNNIFPINAQWFFRLPGVTGSKAIPRLISSGLSANPEDVLRKAQSKLSSADGGPAAEVVEVLPRIKEGGAFVKFTYGPGLSPESIHEAVSKYIEEAKLIPWFAPFSGVSAGLVVGRPWVEDLYRLPSGRLKVEFLPASSEAAAADLSQEDLYAVFRPYGKLSDIITLPSDAKNVPRYAYLDFASIKKAVMAKNCMHGYVLSEPQGGGKLGTILRIGYERKARFKFIWDWLSSHPRIVIPAVAAIIATITVTIFDPIRTLFIKAHIERTLHLEEHKIWRWFKRATEDLLTKIRLRGGNDEEAGMQAIWEDRKADIDQVQAWLMETADTFIVVQGPRGAGKKELVEQALKTRRHTLNIDCKPIQEARGDTKTINAAALEVGYRPVFSWMNSISGMVDLAAQGATGIKTGFSETLDSQLAKIWTNTATALKQIALADRKSNDKDASLSDDEYLEAHPERRPVVVIDNFLHKSTEGGIVYDKLADWAASLTTSNVAHVIFLTHDVSFTKSLSKALPDRVFRQISLSDCSEEVAKRFVINHLDFDQPIVEEDIVDGCKKLSPSQERKDLAQLAEVLPILGGRLTDLEFLARRIKAGETPRKATKEIVDQSASEILKMFLFAGADDVRKWTPQQAWMLIKKLASTESLRYNEILLSDIYKSGGENALAALEQAELITIQSAAGRPYSVKPGRPVYAAAFQQLTQDRVLSSKLDLAILAEGIKVETQSIDKYEQELHLLGELPKQPNEIMSRIQYLLGKIQGSQAKIEGYEQESGTLKKILMSEY